MNFAAALPIWGPASPGPLESRRSTAAGERGLTVRVKVTWAPYTGSSPTC